MNEISVGRDPRTVALTPDGTLAVVANRGSDTISFVDLENPTALGDLHVGRQPYGIVADAARAYVSLFGAGQVRVVDLRARRALQAIEVEPFPAGLALAGSTLYVTHLYSGRVSVVDLEALTVRSVIPAEAESNLAQFILLSPDGAQAYLPLTLSHADRLRQSYRSMVTPAVEILDLPPGAPSERLDLSTIDRPVNLPFAAALSPDGRTLFVANAGSDDVSVIDLENGRAAAHLAVGRNPRGLALSPDGARLFVNNSLDGSLSIFDARSYSPIRTLSLTTIFLPAEILAGQRLFNSARDPMARGHWLSCATCHLDGGADGRTWLGFPDGPRNTPALFGAARTLPAHWSGDLDELQDVERTIRNIQGGAGLITGDVHDSLARPNRGRSPDLDALAAYLATLDFPGPPGAAAPGADAESIQRGKYAFRRWGCAGCHPPPLYTDLKLHDVGIGDAALEHNAHGRGLAMDTPSLLGAWAAPPYFHDGSAPTLRATFFNTGFHSMGYAMGTQEADDLEAFLAALAYRP
jgi:YVTN family beta-propeller protein